MNFKNIKYLTGVILISAFSITSCSKQLDINDNPNSPIESTPQLVLPQTIVGTSQLVVQYNTYGGRMMYFANAGGVSGWGNGFLDYNYSTADYAGLWTNTFNILNDIEYVLNNTRGNVDLASYYYAAHVMKAYNFANLVDIYNNVPYSQALKGEANRYPSYDEAVDIYADLAMKLDSAIAYFKTATFSNEFNSGDVLFKGEANRPIKWAQFANTLKLKLIVKGKGKVDFANETIDAVGVLTNDAIVNPGFTKIDGKQNPMWNTWAYLASGASVGTWGTQFLPTYFAMSFYDGEKLDDEARANLTYGNGLNAPQNQLGDLTIEDPGLSPSTWVLRPTSGTISATNYRGYGIIKGPAAGQPIFLGAESQLLAAEAIVRGIMTGTASEHFETGVKLAYEYLNKNESDVLIAGTNSQGFLDTYKTNNSTSFLVNFSLASTDQEKIEAIVTQKYIAFNFLFSHEGWNEFRRTGYPSIINPATNNPYPNNTANASNTFVSISSLATAQDKLPTRILYPNTEFSYNSANVPSIDKFTSKIFWAK